MFASSIADLRKRLIHRKHRRLIAVSALFDSEFYLFNNPSSGSIDPVDHFLSPAGTRLNPHPLFDCNWYLAENPDVSEAEINPLVHYLLSGWKEGRQPSPLFDRQFYSAGAIPNAAEAINPLSDYLRRGVAASDPHPLFDTKFYLRQLPTGETASSSSPLLDYVKRGWRQGRNPHPLFDVQFYLDQNADVRERGEEPLSHYLVWGWKEGRDPHPLFSGHWYWAQKPHASAYNQNPLLHYLTVGWKEKRSPCAMFDEAFYSSQNPEPNRSCGASLYHYLLFGAAEGRNPNRWFDTRWYLEQNPEVAEQRINPLTHYLEVGALEGRRARPLATKAEASTSEKAGRKRVLFVSGEPATPGHQYRVVQLADSLPRQFFDVSLLSVSEIPALLDDIQKADLIWVWRARRSLETDLLLAARKKHKFTLLYDIDDLMFLPQLATSELIDGIRSQNMVETHIATHYADVKQLLLQADRCTTPTLQLAQEIRELNRPATVIPNGFNRRTFEQSRRAARSRNPVSCDGLIRIGYAAGSLTHQKDFSEASRALSRILAKHPNARLVLFRTTLLVEEFPELAKVQAQIEWRDLVSFDELPSEYARFDINIAPLELGNRFCESKSELKYFEAALVGVPTIASPVGAYAACIRSSENGYLAKDTQEWHQQLDRLISDTQLRARIAESAYQDALWHYGPERRRALVTRLTNEMLAPPPIRYELFRSDLQRTICEPLPPVTVPKYEVLFQSSTHQQSRISVIVPVFNYSHYIEEALDSLLQQTLRDFDVVIVDDQSTDGSPDVAYRWLKRHSSRFNMTALLQNGHNSKLGPTRNAGVSFCDTELYMPLDADNALLPDCLELCLRQLDETGAAFTYPTIAMFGDRHDEIGLFEYDPARFQCINYIDAMALVRKACWIAVGGYSPLEPVGWEDYEFWCKLLEKGLFGVRVPEVTARYRSHSVSMLRTITELPEKKRRIVEEMNRRHGWLQLRATAPQQTLAPELERVTDRSSS